ncbi:MAG: hypothetical protein R2714_17485 [Microthrixaceae bacterium]
MFSLADGEVRGYRSGDTDAFYLDKFGGWRTEYLTFNDTGSATNKLEAAYTGLDVGEMDLRARVRQSDWDSQTAAVIAARWTGGGQGSWIWDLNGSDMRFRMKSSTVDYLNTVAISTLGLTDGEWAWVRVTWSSADRLRWWTSADGSSWTLKETDTAGGATTIDAGSADLRIGNNQSAGGVTANGFGGDIADFEMRNGSGTVIQTLSLDIMDAQADTGWTPETGNAIARGTAVTATGDTISATARVRLDLEEPVAMDDWRLIVDAQTGELTVDEIVLELSGQTLGWKVGTL